ncbi:MAG TPA: hypothetical protein GXX38_04580 [Clostridia bacterium]|nr:hypothetical protein [Clostridia bacterium]
MLKTLKLLFTIMIFIIGFSSVSWAEEVEIDRSQFIPILVLEPVSIETASPGGEFYLTFVIKNYSKHPAFNLNFDFQVEGANDNGKEPFSFIDSETPKLEKIEGNETRNFTFGMRVEPEAQNREYRLRFTLKCQDVFFSDGPSSTVTVPVKVSYDLTKPHLLVNNVVISPENPDLSEDFTVEIEFENISKVEARNLTVFLESQDNFEITDITNKKYFKKLVGGDRQKVAYKIRAKEGRKSNSLQLKLQYDYSGDKNNEQTEQLNLPIEQAYLVNGKNPWVIINKYVLSAEKVLAGNTVTLKLFVENTNNKPVSNVKISLGVIEVEGEQGGTVFSPVNSSNSFYLDTIPGKTIIEKEIDLYVDPNAAAKTYIVPVSIKYEDINGNQLSVDELVNIPVTQESKLQIISVDLPPVGYVGQPIPVGAEFVNVGKVALNNFNVSLEGDFNKENGNYYVGNLDIGASDYFQAMIFPEQEGVLKGNLVFTYVDNNNKDVRIEYPFEIEVQQMDPAMLGPGDMGPDSPGSINGGGRKALSGSMQQIVLWGLLAVVVIETIILIKKKKKEKSGEFFDE